MPSPMVNANICRLAQSSNLILNEGTIRES